MTKKDYILIAEAIKEAKKCMDNFTGMTTPEIAGEIKDEAFGHLQAQLAYKLQNENLHFNESKFIKACEV